MLINFKHISNRENGVIDVIHQSLSFKTYQLMAHLSSTVHPPTFPSLSAAATWSCVVGSCPAPRTGLAPIKGLHLNPTSPDRGHAASRPAPQPHSAQTARPEGREGRPGQRPRRVCSAIDPRLALVSSDSPGRGLGRSRGLFPRSSRETGGLPWSVGSLRCRGGCAGQRYHRRTLI